ncbi:hypothetical protein CC80DRAFT_487707 [Byssothecium circinans]|uniref:Fungal N-terminal domain-containing protein n=1 Tax=Byssothecium circinans TaxID=147558 RepID=A0A6A5UB93_9PLEO|nr:hypothetical protein CC80DRAFT_487707 [Byssothecium circinans]
MAEAMGAGAAVIQLLEAAISVFKHINKAYKQGKNLANLLRQYEIELKEIRDLAVRVSTEESLKETDVSKQLTKLKACADRLCKFLPKLDAKDQSALRTFVQQLLRGQKDMKTLDDIMKQLDHAKDDLDRSISLHHLSITRKIHTAVEGMPKQKRRPTGFSLPARAKTTTMSSDSSSSSTETDDNDTPTESSSSDTEYETSSMNESRSPRVLIVEENEVTKGGFQSNNNCGDEDMLADTNVTIRKNKCVGGFQNNYSNKKADLEGLYNLQLAKQREQMLFYKDFGFSLKEILKVLT